MQVSRQWRDLQLQKEFGLGHDKDIKIQNGSLAQFCPACPQPGINLLQNWQDHPAKYVVYIFLTNYSYNRLCADGFFDGTLL